MIWFVLGFLAGSGALLLFLGFLAVVTEDKEMQEQARQQREQDKKALKNIQDHYREYY